ncbi:FAD-dependent oxidoreductase [Oryzomonas rubra]|uniref:FAD-dependent oxidoreductase n=1 Tax=Oryzomonas rubra TaxID=2509454 RepID=A0A5A9X4P5_9BACT|nr:FAD-dependent oxidoreductase [Oryzomonas rubra]KAA0887966.1 FAD-dependent oxidoreductase [Oryzomonas rubra]
MGKCSKLVRIALIIVTVAFSGSVYAADKTINTDIVVVGGGSTGLTAAVAAAEGGAKVMVFEKNPYLGGSSNFAEGLFAVESELQRAKSYGLTKDEAFKHIMEFGHYKNDATLIRQFVNDSADNIAWLQKQGIEFEVVEISPTEPVVWHLIKQRGHIVHGSALVTALQLKAKELGVDFRLRTPVKKLIYSGNKVTGVQAVDHKGNTITVNAKAVIIGTGGFGNSKEKIKQWTKFDPEAFRPILPLNKTGDGIEMAKAVGADHEGENLMLHPGTEGKGIIPLGGIFCMTWQPNTMWVNKHGERFVDEGIAFSFAQAGNAIGRQSGHYAWAIFDDATVDHVTDKGIDNGVGVIVPVTTKLKSMRTEIKNAVAANSESFKAADSIEELAAQIGVPADSLKKTYNNYNNYATIHYDEQFAKEHRLMKPLNNGRLYAVKLMPYHFTSVGGIRVNNNMAVLDKDDRPIEGLYAGGNDVGGLYSDTYTLWASGHAYGWATYSGRMAGLSALKAIK